ncbi:MAG: rRNA maturation RNase YbeY [Bacteroidota bacterium]
MRTPHAPDKAEAMALYLDHPTHTLDLAVLRPVLVQLVADAGYTLQHLSVVFTDHDTVLDLNRTYLEHDYHTDVLSFALSDTPLVVDGEVYVDLDTAAERHAEFNTAFSEEAYRYALHGTLHLVGHDDATPSGRATMRSHENHYLALLTG